jgi:photosystem II stability/assembly factor-like uncharacterized protein
MKKNLLVSFVAVFCFYNCKAQWLTQASGFANPNIAVISITPVDANVVWACGADLTFSLPNQNLYSRTTNGGTTWMPGSIAAESNSTIVSISALNKDTAWVAMNNDFSGGGSIYRTNDGGVNWVKQSSVIFAAPDGFVNFVHFFDKNNGVCIGDPNSGYFDIYTTANGGTNWNRVSSSSIPANLTNEVVSGPQSCVAVGNAVWFGTDAGRTYKSTNKGASWTVSNTALANCSIIAFKDVNNGIANDSTGAIAQTTNGGTSWNIIGTPGMQFIGLSYVPGTSGTYVSTDQSGSYYSNDNGLHWTNIDADLHLAVAFINATTGWSGGVTSNGTTDGMFKWIGNFTGIEDKSIDNAVNAFPNPFKDKIIIRLESPEQDKKYMVEIFDVRGEVLQKESLNTNLAATVNTSAYSPGIYFYKITADGLILKTGKLVKD